MYKYSLNGENIMYALNLIYGLQRPINLGYRHTSRM